MSTLYSILIALIAGFVLYSTMLYSALSFDLPVWVKKVLVWNVLAFSFLGPSASAGNMPDGHPAAESVNGIGAFSIPGIFSGFVIYPLLIFIGIYLFTRIRRSSN